MVMSALQQMLRDVSWGELDIMIVDMPPGTGDAQLTMAQQVALAGAVIVSTPQDIALIDARKGLAMFQKVDVPVLGIIENMSYFLCPHCGERSDIFSHGGARREAERLGTDFLGEVPLDMAIRETSDDGRPITASAPDSPYARTFRDIAARVWTRSRAKPLRGGPRRGLWWSSLAVSGPHLSHAADELGEFGAIPFEMDPLRRRRMLAEADPGAPLGLRPIGRGTKPPPQFGQTSNSKCSTHRRRTCTRSCRSAHRPRRAADPCRRIRNSA